MFKSWTIFGRKIVDVLPVSEKVQRSSLELDSGSRNRDTADIACLYSVTDKLARASAFWVLTDSVIWFACFRGSNFCFLAFDINVAYILNLTHI